MRTRVQSCSEINQISNTQGSKFIPKDMRASMPIVYTEEQLKEAGSFYEQSVAPDTQQISTNLQQNLKQLSTEQQVYKSFKTSRSNIKDPLLQNTVDQAPKEPQQTTQRSNINGSNFANKTTVGSAYSQKRSLLLNKTGQRMGRG